MGRSSGAAIERKIIDCARDRSVSRRAARGEPAALAVPTKAPLASKRRKADGRRGSVIPGFGKERSRPTVQGVSLSACATGA
jgi:hypothetical protein